MTNLSSTFSLKLLLWTFTPDPTTSSIPPITPFLVHVDRCSSLKVGSSRLETITILKRYGLCYDCARCCLRARSSSSRFALHRAANRARCHEAAARSFGRGARRCWSGQERRRGVPISCNKYPEQILTDDCSFNYNTDPIHSLPCNVETSRSSFGSTSTCSRKLHSGSSSSPAHPHVPDT